MSDHRKDELDSGAFIGHEPELAEETIPGGTDPDDERVAAHSTQVGPRSADRPDGHREGPGADDDAVREAGQNR